MMKPQIDHKGVISHLCNLTNLLLTGMIVVFCLLNTRSFSQEVAVIRPSTNTTYKLSDPTGMETLSAIKGAITSAESTAEVLNADAEKEKAQMQSAEIEYKRAESIRENYLTGIENYSKNGYGPYMSDYNSYTADAARYDEVLGRHNSAVAASNSLAPEQRSAATVTILNSEKRNLDTWKVKLDTWKTSLDDAKAKLDAQRAALLLQKDQYEAAYNTALENLKGSQTKLKGLLDQLALCESYADKCKSILASKFNLTDTSTTGYFGSGAYKGAVTELNIALEKSKTLSLKPAEGN